MGSALTGTQNTVGRQARSDAAARLRSARGHLDAVIRMLDADRYCIDVLHQLRAVQGAIDHARREILTGHLRGCVLQSADSAATSETIEEILAAVLGDRQPATRDAQRTVL